MSTLECEFASRPLRARRPSQVELAADFRAVRVAERPPTGSPPRRHASIEIRPPVRSGRTSAGPRTASSPLEPLAVRIFFVSSSLSPRPSSLPLLLSTRSRHVRSRRSRAQQSPRCVHLRTILPESLADLLSFAQCKGVRAFSSPVSLAAHDIDEALAVWWELKGPRLVSSAAKLRVLEVRQERNHVAWSASSRLARPRRH